MVCKGREVEGCDLDKLNATFQAILKYVSSRLPAGRPPGAYRFGAGAGRGDMTTSAIPPNTATEAKRNRKVSGSPRRSIPPAAARTGTLSCTVAALAAFRPGSAVYQMT
jgi:hypothetical protein